MNRTSQLPSLGSFFDDFFSDDSFNWNLKNHANFGHTLPSVNLEETEKEYHIEVAAPGMKKEDFSIHLGNNNVLTISSEQKSEHEEKEDDRNYHRKEFSYSSFRRSFSLPTGVDAEKVEALYKDGILKITVPKNGNEQETIKRIEIK